MKHKPPMTESQIVASLNDAQALFGKPHGAAFQAAFGMTVREAWSINSISRIMTPPGQESNAALSVGFWATLGMFHAVWSSIDLITDLAISKFLDLSPENTHLTTSGMMFGRKARLLADLIRKSDHPKRAALLGAFNKIRGEGKRDIIAHAYIGGGDKPGEVSLIERQASGAFNAKRHKYKVVELMQHATSLALAVGEIHGCLGLSQKEIDAFAEAAFKASRKEDTSPA